MDSDEEDFVFYGTPIEREEEVSSRKKKALAEASGNLRSLPAWKQEVALRLSIPFSFFWRVDLSEYSKYVENRVPAFEGRVSLRSLCALPAFHIREGSRNYVHQLSVFACRLDRGPMYPLID